MKEKIKKALKTKYQALGLPETVLDGVTEMLEKTVTEEGQIETAVSGVEEHLKIFQRGTDSLRNEKSGLQNKLDALQKEQPSPQPNTQPTPTGGENQIDIAKLVADAVASSMQPYMQKIDGFETTNRQKTRSQMFEEATKGLSSEFLNPLRQSFELIGEVDDDKFQKFIETTQTSTKEIIAKQNSFVPGSGKSPSGEASDKEIESLAKGLV